MPLLYFKLTITVPKTSQNDYSKNNINKNKQIDEIKDKLFVKPPFRDFRHLET